MSILWERMPSIELIENQELKLRVRSCWNEAIKRSIFTEEEVSEIAFTLLIPDCPANLLQHTESVTACAYELAVKLQEKNPILKFDMDILVSGGLLHDVGKVLE
ncbi:MAG: HD domain-containing protein, partial [Candidatus Zixiibacteriota bacterium]